MAHDAILSAHVGSPVTIVLPFAFAVGVGIGCGVLTALATRVWRNGLVAPIGYVLVARAVADGLSPATGATWTFRTLLVLVTLMTMTGILLVCVQLFAAEERHARRDRAEPVGTLARPVPRWGPALVASMLMLLSGVTAALAP